MTRSPDDPISRSPEAGALHLLAEVFAGDLDLLAHFVQARAHAFGDAVAEGLLAGGSLSLKPVNWFIVRPRGSRRQVGEVGGNQGGALIVVTGVEHVADGVPH